MKRNQAVSYLFVLLLCLAACAGRSVQTSNRQTQPPRRIVVRAARLFDVERGQIIEHPVVVIEGDKITAVGTGVGAPPSAQIFDLGDVTLLPGPIDAHTHITYHFDQTGHFGLTNDASP